MNSSPEKIAAAAPHKPERDEAADAGRFFGSRAAPPSTGGAEPSTTPVWLVPRQMGQLSSEEANVWVVRTAAKAIPMQRDGFRRFIMGVLLGSSTLLTGRMAVEVSQKSGNPATMIKLWIDSGQRVFRCLGMIQG